MGPAGDLVHVDVKKIGRIPDGGGWRIHGRGSTQHQATERAKNAGARAGYVYLHTAIDDHSRLAYTEELLDEKGATAAAFWARAVKFFRRHGIRRIHRVLTDNGSCYRSFVFAAALTRSKTRHKRTRPYRPQTNGKVERYHRTLAQEWPTAKPGPATRTAPRHSKHSSTATTIVDPTPHSANDHPSAASPPMSTTSLHRTSKSRSVKQRVRSKATRLRKAGWASPLNRDNQKGLKSNIGSSSLDV